MERSKSWIMLNIQKILEMPPILCLTIYIGSANKKGEL